MMKCCLLHTEIFWNDGWWVFVETNLSCYSKIQVMRQLLLSLRYFETERWRGPCVDIYMYEPFSYRTLHRTTTSSFRSNLTAPMASLLKKIQIKNLISRERGWGGSGSVRKILTWLVFCEMILQEQRRWTKYLASIDSPIAFSLLLRASSCLYT